MGEKKRKEKQSIWTLSSQTGRCDSSHLPGRELHGGCNGSTRNQQRDKSSQPGGGGKLQLLCWLVHKLLALLLKWHAENTICRMQIFPSWENLLPVAWIIPHLTSGRKYHIMHGSVGASGAATTRRPRGTSTGQRSNLGRQQITGKREDTSNKPEKPVGLCYTWHDPNTNSTFKKTQVYLSLIWNTVTKPTLKLFFPFLKPGALLIFVNSGDKKLRFHYL